VTSILSNYTSERVIKFEEFTLGNGLHCIMHKDNSNPIASVTVGYKVGSKDERKGLHGIAHLFEHMMFQGSKNIRKNEHFGHVLRSGGSCNAFTMQDATVYFETLPSNGLETALWLESDRMNSLNITEENLENQKSVVLEEKKQVFDNAPYGNMFNDVFRNLFPGSGYEHSVIGTVQDITSFSVEGAMNFHRNFYSPSNSVLVITGDINYGITENLVRKYFDGLRTNYEISRRPNVIAPVENSIVEDHYDNIQLPAINICYQVPAAGSHEEYALDYFSEIMANSESSRLYKKFVYEEKLVRSLGIMNYPLANSGALMIKAYVNPGIDVTLVREKLMNEVKLFADEGCSEREFEKVRNSLEFSSIAKHLKVQNIAIETVFNHLNFENAMRINEDSERYLSVKKNEISEVVKKHVVDANSVVINYLPANATLKTNEAENR
jgi:zinc protease